MRTRREDFFLVEGAEHFKTSDTPEYVDQQGVWLVPFYLNTSICIRFRTHRSKPEDDGSSERDSGHEGARAAIVAGVDTAPVLEATE
jgi:hypothetical protein